MGKEKRWMTVVVMVLLTVCSWCFWALRYPHAMAYQEQLQMFLFDHEYFTERICLPGGLARYVSEFLVQFYNNVYAGAFVISMLLLAVHYAVSVLSRRRDESCFWYALTLLPSLALWMSMGDMNVRLMFAVSLLFALVAMVGYPHWKDLRCRVSYLVILTPLLFMAAGPSFFVFALYASLTELTSRRSVVLALLALFYSVACVICVAPFVPCPVYRLFYGIGYSLVINELPTSLYAVMALTAVTPVVTRLLPVPDDKSKRSLVISLCMCVAAALLTAGVYPSAFQKSRYDVLRSDYLMRSMRWDSIIREAEKEQPHAPLTVATLNLALAMRGQLTERGGQFFQNGWQGAFPAFNKNFEYSIMTAEIYYHLGLINTAQRLDFEAMEAIPDNNKSVRVVKRLAETNIINGDYVVARRYLRLLEKTMFYSAWAKRTLSLVGNDMAVETHPEYGYLRKMRLRNDFFFSEQEIDKIMGQLVMSNKDNNLAVQYLLFLPQLEGDRQKYMMYLDFVNKIRSGAVSDF